MMIIQSTLRYYVLLRCGRIFIQRCHLRCFVSLMASICVTICSQIALYEHSTSNRLRVCCAVLLISVYFGNTNSGPHVTTPNIQYERTITRTVFSDENLSFSHSSKLVAGYLMQLKAQFKHSLLY